MSDDPELTFSATFRDPWWEGISEEEWAAMSPRERLLTKMAIPRLQLFREGDPNVVAVDAPGRLLASGDTISLAVRVEV